jgi:hypothetical protein
VQAWVYFSSSSYTTHSPPTTSPNSLSSRRPSPLPLAVIDRQCAAPTRFAATSTQKKVPRKHTSDVESEDPAEVSDWRPYLRACTVSVLCFLSCGLFNSVRSIDLAYLHHGLPSVRAAALAPVRQHDTKEFMITPSGDLPASSAGLGLQLAPSCMQARDPFGPFLPSTPVAGPVSAAPTKLVIALLWSWNNGGIQERNAGDLPWRHLYSPNFGLETGLQSRNHGEHCRPRE